VSDQPQDPVVRVRREPPRFRRVTVGRLVRLTSRLSLVTFTGPDLDGFVVDEPAASVRLLVPPSGSDALVMGTWTGNEFLLPDGRRPGIRTFTPLRSDPAALELDLAIVLHGEGVVSRWVERARPGDEVAVSGPGRGYRIDPDAPAFLLVGDESAAPALGQVLAAVPSGTPVSVHVEVDDLDARPPLPEHPGAEVGWHRAEPGSTPGSAMVEAVRDAVITPGSRIWVAGEAAAVQRIRRHLFEDRGLSRSEATVRGYWKHGRAGDVDEA
jgi:NADPH-dependent ferric siderophore reductase